MEIRQKICYKDGDSFIVYIKTEDIYAYIGKDVETRFDTSNYKLDRLLPKGKIKKVTGLMKDELSGKIMNESVKLTTKTYSYLMATYSYLMIMVKKIKKTERHTIVCHKKKT